MSVIPKSKSKKFAMVDENYCVACGACMKECLLKAIEVKKGHYAVVDAQKCVGCGKCVKICPASLIELQQRGVIHNEG